MAEGARLTVKVKGAAVEQLSEIEMDERYFAQALAWMERRLTANPPSETLAAIMLRKLPNLWAAAANVWGEI